METWNFVRHIQLERSTGGRHEYWTIGCRNRSLLLVPHRYRAGTTATARLGLTERSRSCWCMIPYPPTHAAAVRFFGRNTMSASSRPQEPCVNREDVWSWWHHDGVETGAVQHPKRSLGKADDQVKGALPLGGPLQDFGKFRNYIFRCFGTRITSFECN